jgi:hypothetical protein
MFLPVLSVFLFSCLPHFLVVLFLTVVIVLPTDGIEEMGFPVFLVECFFVQAVFLVPSLLVSLFENVGNDVVVFGKGAE